MKQKNINFVLILLLLVSSFVCYFKPDMHNNLHINYVPDYQKKYNDLLETYDLIRENYNFIPAQVTNLSNLKLTNLFYINKGKNNDIIENSYVVNEKGLVGVVKKVFNSFSVVKLISSVDLSIPVEVNDCYGTLKNSVKNSYINDLINCSDVKIGDPVFTSKYSISSSNIYIGKVKNIKNNKLYIDYGFNPYKIKYVGVIYDSY